MDAGAMAAVLVAIMVVPMVVGVAAVRTETVVMAPEMVMDGRVEMGDQEEDELVETMVAARTAAGEDVEALVESREAEMLAVEQVAQVTVAETVVD
jgi:hypothetical protein|eukprot:6996115-Prymnesium_polylepis.1